jgi:hypothetical protein
MSDSFEFTLHSPLTQEDWNKISDVEHENTMSVTFQTPQGRQVRYIKCEVLDKIRAEIDSHCSDNRDRNDGLYIAMKIIDKYKSEGSEE